MSRQKSKAKQMVDVAEVSIRNLVIDLERVAEHLCVKKGMVPIDLAVRERLNVPRGKVFIYQDSETWGRLILQCRPEDHEAVDAMLNRAKMRMRDIEADEEAIAALGGLECP